MASEEALGVYYTTWDKTEDLEELYSEWIGKPIHFKRVFFNSLFTVARLETSNRFVGVAQLIIIDDPIFDRVWGLVENVYVSKDFRNQGIGQGLMKEVEEQAHMMGCQFIKLTTRKELGQKLYRSLSYEEGSSFRKSVLESRYREE